MFAWPRAVLSVWKQFTQKITCVQRAWTGSAQTPCKKAVQSQFILTNYVFWKPDLHCSHHLSTVLQVTMAGRQQEYNDPLELYKLSPEQGLECFFHFQPMCQHVLTHSYVPTLRCIDVRHHFPNRQCQCLFPYQDYLCIKINNRMSSEKKFSVIYFQ